MGAIATEEEYNELLHGEIFGIADYAETLPEKASAEQLDKAAPAMLRYILQSMPKGYGDGIDAFDPEPSEANNWLFSQDTGAFEGKFIDRRAGGDRVFQFSVKREGDQWIRVFSPISGVKD